MNILIVYVFIIMRLIIFYPLIKKISL